MPKYLVQANYVGEGLKGLLKEGGSSRRGTIEKLLGSVGGRVEAFYYAFGDTDALVIVDLPDNVTAAALSLTINAAAAVTAALPELRQLYRRELDIVVVRDASAAISASFIPRVVTAGVPRRMPLAWKGERVSKGMVFLLTVMPALSSDSCAILPVSFLGRRSTSIK